jgi:hypothetical protein
MGTRARNPRGGPRSLPPLPHGEAFDVLELHVGGRWAIISATAAPRWTPRSIAARISARALRRRSSQRSAGARTKLAKTSAVLRRDSTSASSSAQNNAKNKSSRRLKKQNEETEAHSPVHRRSDSVRCERASAASSSSEVTTILTVANSSRAS